MTEQHNVEYPLQKLVKILLKEDTQVVNKHTKRCSTLLIIRQMQIKTMMRYHVTSIWMAAMKNRGTCWRGVGEIGGLVYC